MKTILAVIGAVALLLVLGLLAVCNDDEGDPDSFGPIQLVSHEYGGGYDDGGYGAGRYDECDPSWDDCSGDSYRNDYSSRDRHRNERRNRGAFSPGPFQDSPVTIIICPPGTQYCGSDGGQGQEPPPDEGGYA